MFKIGDIVVIDNTDKQDQKRYLGRVGKIISFNGNGYGQTTRIKLDYSGELITLYTKKIKMANKPHHPFTKIFL